RAGRCSELASWLYLLAAVPRAPPARSALAREQARDGGFAARELRAAAFAPVARARAVLLRIRARNLAGRECRDDLRMDVIAFADRERVAEHGSRVPRGLVDDTRGLGVARARLARGELLEGRDRPGPGPKVLGREALPRQLLEQRVDVARRDGAQLAALVEITEQPLPRQLVTAAQRA